MQADVPDIADAEPLFSGEAVQAAVAHMGVAISEHLAGCDCVAICLLQGGIVPAGTLLPHIDAPVELDSVDVSRYRKGTRGGEVDWRWGPREQPVGRRVLLIDDILDEGKSLAAVREGLLAAGAADVRIAVLAAKHRPDRAPSVTADFVGLEVPDRYVFGFGMDYRGWYRNAAGIFAFAE